jgi:hypothetical protein
MIESEDLFGQAAVKVEEWLVISHGKRLAVGSCLSSITSARSGPLMRQTLKNISEIACQAPKSEKTFLMMKQPAKNQPLTGKK